MKQQTAVEWLINRHFGGVENCTLDFKKHIEQAKQMEKEQMCNHFREGYMFANSPMLSVDENGKIIQSMMKYGELYYNKKYKL